MDYSIKINEFEGPLDLLLHLIKEANIDIYDINLEEITNQYLDYIKKMEELNIDVASSYLVMASELIELKSKSLLPNKKEELKEEEEEEENTKENLIKKLVLYKAYKEVSKEFQTLEEDRKKIIVKSPENINLYIKEEEITQSGDVDALMEAFRAFLERSKLNKPLHTKITSKEYSVDERSVSIKHILREKKKMNFTELFDIRSKDYIVVTFLSVLDLVRKNQIVLTQERNFEDILLELKDSDKDE